MSMAFSRTTLAGALALSLTSLNTVAHGAEPKPGRIDVSATASAAVAPDMAVMDLSVIREADTAAEALTVNNAAMAEVLASLKEAGIADKDLQTSNFNIQPRYFYPKRLKNGEQQPPRIVGYQVSNSLTVRLRDLAKLGSVLDRTVRLGVNSGGQVRFTNDNPDAAREQARKNAMAKAMAKAKTLAEGAGVKVGRVLAISERGAAQPRPIARMARSVAKAEAAVPVASGENSYAITVNVSFEIQQ
ncbi:MAG: SIMPL domain-containing protein [Pseudomonadota bacterium]